MENIFISNGSIQLVVIPRNEHESEMLRRLADQGTLEVEFTTAPIAIVDKSAKNTLIIKKKQQVTQ